MSSCTCYVILVVFSIGNEVYIFRQCMYIVLILQCQRAQKLTTAKLSKKSINKRRSNLFFFFVSYLQLPVQSVPISTKVVSSNPVYVKLYLLRHIGGFLRVFWFPQPIKLTATIKLKYC
jgi:hypothetical protein